MKFLLVVLAACTGPVAPVCTTPTSDESPEATVYIYPRKVDCVRDRVWFEETFHVEAACTGEAFYPPHAERG